MWSSSSTVSAASCTFKVLNCNILAENKSKEMEAVIRPLVTLPNVENKKPWLRVLTYNILAQALIRREQYPTNGSFIKFAKRFPALTQEIKEYKPDILLLQEVDIDKYGHWKEILSNMNTHLAHHETKRHGLLLAYNKSIFKKIDFKEVSYDDYGFHDSDGLSIPSQNVTGNICAVMVLEHLETGHRYAVGTTHLYWHGEACYERARQVTIFSYELLKIMRTNNAESIIIGGDFNSNPVSPGHSFLKNNFHFNDNAKNIISRSSKYEQFGAVGATEAQKRTSLLSDPDGCVKKLLSEAEKVSGPPLKSCYFIDGKEPKFTNWTDNFRDVIDYIFVSDDLTPTSVLALPTEKDLGPEPSSLPRARNNQGYPSDHLPLMVELS